MEIKTQNIFKELSKDEGEWHSEKTGDIDSRPVYIRTMKDTQAPFHIHKNNDEMFVVLDGELHLDMKNDSVCLKKGESFTVRAGTEHRARVIESAKLIVIGGMDT